MRGGAKRIPGSWLSSPLSLVYLKTRSMRDSSKELTGVAGTHKRSDTRGCLLTYTYTQTHRETHRYTDIHTHAHAHTMGKIDIESRLQFILWKSLGFKK